MTWFMFAMIAYPEKQKNVKRSLIHIPTFEVRNLPYVSATIRELLRWKSVVPLSDARPELRYMLIQSFLRQE